MNKDNRNEDKTELHHFGLDYDLDVQEYFRLYLQEQMEKSLGKPSGVDVIEEIRKLM
jgi:hypothetical protein